MLKFLADENFDGRVLSQLLIRLPHLDIIRAQDTELYQKPDPVVLEWAAQQSRILITHDIRTIPDFANDRVANGLPMPGVIEVKKRLPIGDALDGLIFLISAGTERDFQDQIWYIPLR